MKYLIKRNDTQQYLCLFKKEYCTWCSEEEDAVSFNTYWEAEECCAKYISIDHSIVGIREDIKIDKCEPIEVKQEVVKYQCPICGYFSQSKQNIKRCISQHQQPSTKLCKLIYDEWSEDDFIPRYLDDGPNSGEQIEFDDLSDYCEWEEPDYDRIIKVNYLDVIRFCDSYGEWLEHMQKKVATLRKMAVDEKINNRYVSN